MTQTSRVWDGTTIGDAGTAPYDAATEFSKVLMSIAGAAGIPTNLSGVFRSELNELATTGVATPVSTNSGRAMVWGTWYENDAAVTTAIPTPSGATRIDRIVLRKDWAAQTVRITRIAGVEGGGAPALTQVAATTWDQPIAQVSITTGGVIAVTDQRQFLGGSSLLDNIDTVAVGDLLYADTTTTLARIPIGTANQALQTNAAGTLPAWTSTLLLGLGTAGAPTYSFIGDSNTGAYSPGADQWAVATGGTKQISVDASGNVVIATTLAVGATPSVSGAIRIPYAASIVSRNSGNSADGVVIQTAAADTVGIGGATFTKTQFGGGNLFSYTVPECRAYHNANQSINNTTLTALALNSERYDTDSIHDTVTNNGRLTCKTAGKYRITAQLIWAASAVAGREISIRLNGATIIAQDDMLAAPGTYTDGMSISTTYDLAVNDYVEFMVYQDSGGALNVNSASAYSPEFMMERVG